MYFQMSDWARTLILRLCDLHGDPRRPPEEADEWLLGEEVNGYLKTWDAATRENTETLRAARFRIGESAQLDAIMLKVRHNMFSEDELDG
jgi:hypothetical protein